METLVKITNKELFNQTVNEVDTSSLSSTNYFNGNRKSFCAQGHLTIELSNGEYIDSDGQHGSNDFEADYGFILYCKN